jgi:hypothetical protein
MIVGGHEVLTCRGFVSIVGPARRSGLDAQGSTAAARRSARQFHGSRSVIRLAGF